jgi:hypothetical protein
VDEDKLVQLNGQMNPLARPENDQGAVPDSLPMPHMLLLLLAPALIISPQRLLLTCGVDSIAAKTVMVPGSTMGTGRIAPRN